MEAQYARKCEQACMDAVKPFQHFLAMRDAGHEDKVLKLNGNTAALFRSRITYMQLLTICDMLSQQHTVELLDLSYNDATSCCKRGDPVTATFGDKGAEVVSNLVRSNSALKHVMLEGNSITGHGATYLANIFAQADATCSCLQVLNLARNPISDQGAGALAAALSTHACTLRLLDVGNCDIGLKGLLAICQALETNTTLQSLSLEGCLLPHPQRHSVRSLAHMLKINCTLKQLYLAHHGIQDDGLSILFEHGLQHNTALEVLDLGSNQLSPKSAPVISSLLRHNNSLQVLCLQYNRIGDDGAISIADALPFNRTLVELDVRKCSIGDIGLTHIANALSAGSLLAKCQVWGNAFGLKAAAAWRDLAQQNEDGRFEIVLDIKPYECDDTSMIAFLNQ